MADPGLANTDRARQQRARIRDHELAMQNRAANIARKKRARRQLARQGITNHEARQPRP